MTLGMTVIISLFLVAYIVFGVLAVNSVLYHTIDCCKLTLGDIIRLIVFLPLAVCAYLILGLSTLVDKLDGYIEKLDNKRIL